MAEAPSVPIAPFPADEEERLAALRALRILDTPPEERFDRISRLAAATLHVPVAYISLIDGDRQWYKSVCGADLRETTRRDALCSHTILSDGPLLCPDTLLEPRFADNLFVVNPPNVRFYMGQPLSTPEGHKVGTFCTLGFEPRPITPEQRQVFLDLAAMAETEVNLMEVTTLHAELLERKKELRAAYASLESHSLFVREVFGRFVTEQVAEILLRSPQALELGGEARTLSILMSDLRNFTPLSERLSADRVVSTLNSYLARMVPIIERHGGTINEFIGDAILVLFGAPVPQEDHARQAVACALEMQVAMAEVNRELELDGPLEMGIAVNTGTVVVGNIGSPQRMKYGVVGSPVNLTARIQSFALGGQVLVSEATLRPLLSDVRLDGHLRVKVKGVDGPISVYDVGALRGAGGVELPRPPHFLPPGAAASPGGDPGGAGGPAWEPV